uniref:Uncharacterized protein n=1 Tax=Phytophthora fragariae TaxID=53985 RepID=A0A6A3EGZ3_9STRA|nr:hypothetical protein PF009_g18388 [Phytophthora fragariae]
MKIKAQDAKIGAQDDKIQCQGRLIENMLAKDEEVSELIHCELNENDAEEVAVTEGVKENELLCFVYPRGWFTHE